MESSTGVMRITQFRCQKMFTRNIPLEFVTINTGDAAQVMPDGLKVDSAVKSLVN